jgi:outer membrane lipopolysaccharide assembly protein LptE/RlpB
VTSRAFPGLAGVLLGTLVLGAGCGYSLRGNLPPDVKTVGVPIFRNLTAEPAVEGFITRAVVEAFVRNGRLRVVNPSQADAILEGEVVGYTVFATAFNPNENITAYRLVVTLNLTFRDVKRKSILFQQSGLQEQADFRVLGQVSQTISREETAVSQAAVQIAHTVVSLAVERF